MDIPITSLKQKKNSNLRRKSRNEDNLLKLGKIVNNTFLSTFMKF